MTFFLLVTSNAFAAGPLSLLLEGQDRLVVALAANRHVADVERQRRGELELARAELDHVARLGLDQCRLGALLGVGTGFDLGHFARAARELDCLAQPATSSRAQLKTTRVEKKCRTANLLWKQLVDNLANIRRVAAGQREDYDSGNSRDPIIAAV